MSAIPGQRIRWDEVKECLRQSQRRLEESLVVDDKQRERILRERTERLARRGRDVAVAGARRRFLVVELAGERFGIELSRVRQIVAIEECTPVPGGPPELAGVLNIRGEVVSVIDLRRLLGLSENGRLEAGMVLLVPDVRCVVGWLVDAAVGIQEVAEDQVTATVEQEGSHAWFVAGVTSEGIRILRTEAVFDHPVYRASRD